MCGTVVDEVVAIEVLVVTPAVRNVIRQNRIAELPSYVQASRRGGSHTFAQRVEALVRRGIVGPDAWHEIASPEGALGGGGRASPGKRVRS